MSKQKTIIVDSDVLVALAKEDDTNHKKAQQTLTKLSKKPVLYTTSNYVFSETVTVISQRVGHSQALSFIQELKSPESLFSMQWIDEELEGIAIQIFKKQTSKNVSFVDCTNMALIKHYRLNAIFSFDSIYERNGFTLAEDLKF
jgi:predicted nucleic acid-binding protein